MTTRLYRRLGQRYIGFCHLLFTLASALYVAFTVVVFSFFMELSRGETLGILAIGVAAVIGVVGIGGWLWFVRGAAGPVNAWIAAGRPPGRAAEVWRVAASLPWRTLRSYAISVIPLFAVLGTGMLVVWLGLNPSEAAVCLLAFVVTASYPAVLFTLMLEVELRPVLRDLCGRLSSSIDRPRVGPGLGAKLMLALPITNIAAGGIVGLITVTFAEGTVADLGVALLIAVAVALSTALVPTALIVRSVTVPVEDLVDATERVGGGNFDRGVAVLSADELGRLAEGFNLMLSGLSEREQLAARNHEFELVAQRHEREREARASEAVLDERGRVMRELHDVVDHATSVITLRAVEARRAATADRRRAREPLAAIEVAGREALSQLRTLLDGLRRGQELARSPQPSTADLNQLTRSLGEVGMTVRLELRGAQRALAPSIELSIYRIVQATLTDALRRAPGSCASVEVEYGQRWIVVGVETQAPAHRQGSPRWLTGIHERIALLGGELDVVARRRDAGLVLRASLPASEPASSAPTEARVG